MRFARDRQAEIMDSLDLDERRHLIALDALQRINRFSGTVGQLWSDIRPTAVRYRDRPLNLLDLACGGGDVALGLESRGRRQGFDIRVMGCDASPVAIAAELESVGITAHCALVEPSLEDVFLDIVERSGRQ